MVFGYLFTGSSRCLPFFFRNLRDSCGIPSVPFGPAFRPGRRDTPLHRPEHLLPEARRSGNAAVPGNRYRTGPYYKERARCGGAKNVFSYQCPGARGPFLHPGPVSCTTGFNPAAGEKRGQRRLPACIPNGTGSEPRPQAPGAFTVRAHRSRACEAPDPHWEALPPPRDPS